MKKCSKSHHEALAQLNITPLLDLAFVLLVIFIITTTPIVNDLDLDLPKAASRPKDPKPKITYITVQSSGTIFLNKEPVDLPALQDKLIALRLDTPDLNVVLRDSGKAKYQHIVSIMDILQQVNVAKVNLATEAFSDKSSQRN